jgi:hypothetical protein
MDGLLLLRQDGTSALEASLYEPVLCLIFQGRKQVSIGEETLSFGVGDCLLVSHDLPVCSRITRAPYLALVFEVDLATIRRLTMKSRSQRRAASAFAPRRRIGRIPH